MITIHFELYLFESAEVRQLFFSKLAPWKTLKTWKICDQFSIMVYTWKPGVKVKWPEKLFISFIFIYYW